MGKKTTAAVALLETAAAAGASMLFPLPQGEVIFSSRSLCRMASVRVVILCALR